MNQSSPYSISEWIKSLNNISEMILMDGKLDVTTDAILQTLKKHMGAYAAIHLRLDEKKENLVLSSFTQNKMVSLVLKAIPFSVDGLKYPLHVRKMETGIARCIKKNKILLGESLSDFFYPVFSSKKLLDKIQKIIGLNMCVAAPVRIKDQPIGAFFVVTKKSMFTPEEMDLLQFYSNIAGISYENRDRLDKLAQKYEQEKETTALLGHEIKTPIAIAYNNTQLLGSFIKKNEILLGSELEDVKYIEAKLKTGLEHMNQICKSILSLRDVENNVFNAIQKLDIKYFLTQIIWVYKKKAQAKKMELRCTYNIDPGTFYGGGSQFEEIVANLLDNAIKYTEEGSIHVRVDLNGRQLTCSIRDTGIGIPKEEHAKIFDRYYRVANQTSKPHTHGLGLGLYISKRIVDALGGTITVKSNRGPGITFMVSIPVYKKKPAELAK